MAGVLFVVNIPSHNFEKNENPIRRKNLQTEFDKSVDLAREESDQIEISDPIDIEHQQPNDDNLVPLTTPEMQNMHQFKHPDSEGTLGTRKHLSSNTLSISMESFETGSVKVGFADSIRTKSQTLIPPPLSNKKSYQKSWEGIKDMLNSTKKESSKEKEDTSQAQLDLAYDSSMEQVMKEIIKAMKLESAAWIPTKDGDGFQIIFSIDSGQRCDKTIRMLSEWGIGERDLSSVSVIPCTRYHKPFVSGGDSGSEKSEEPKESSWDTFLLSVRARLNVAQIVEEVRWNATITFDFVILLVVAAILAAFGLVEDNTLFLAASMLISPLMGPIISAIFGTVIKDDRLRMMGVVNELIGIFAATLVGFLFGLVICSIDDRYSSGQGLTKEIISRCELHSLMVGVLIALPSGAAVAIAILGENMGSLVGTAISASLLPPAVNAGLLWALACIYTLFEKDSTRYNSVITSNIYSDHQGMELLVFGSISMLLTISNVICIYCMGVLFLKIKEVAPVVSENQKQFWKHDIKIARDYNKTLHGEDAAAYSERMAKELAEYQKYDQEAGLRGVGAELLRNGNVGSHQNTWSPLSSRHYQTTARTSIHDLEAIYLSLSTHQPVHHHRYTRIPQSFYTKRNWSPPKYRSIPDDTRSPAHQRRSVPIDAFSPKTDKFKSSSAPLSRIAEMSQATLNLINSQKPSPPENATTSEAKNAKKFIVTPAVDPLKND